MVRAPASRPVLRGLVADFPRSFPLQRKFQKSPNIVTLFGATSHKNREGNFMEYLLLMELCPGECQVTTT